jgi:tetrahydromethanopterin S-methyltransferase subunit A
MNNKKELIEAIQAAGALIMEAKAATEDGKVSIWEVIGAIPEIKNVGKEIVMDWKFIVDEWESLSHEEMQEIIQAIVDATGAEKEQVSSFIWSIIAIALVLIGEIPEVIKNWPWRKK